MADRTRPIRIEFCVTEQEKKLIERKMAQLGTRNMGAYLRKMAIYGYIIKVDYTEQKKLTAAVSRAATNINHICRRINSTGHSYADDIADLKERQAEIWSLLREVQKKEL
jgi:hypothetical protein